MDDANTGAKARICIAVDAALKRRSSTVVLAAENPLIQEQSQRRRTEVSVPHVGSGAVYSLE